MYLIFTVNPLRDYEQATEETAALSPGSSLVPWCRTNKTLSGKPEILLIYYYYYYMY